MSEQQAAVTIDYAGPCPAGHDAAWTSTIVHQSADRPLTVADFECELCPR